MKTNMQTRRRRQRRGAAAVEMAIVAPVLITMLFGIIEFGWVFAVQNQMVNAAREGARVGVLDGSDAGDIEDRVEEYLSSMNLQDKVTVAIDEADDDDPMVRVTLSVPRGTVSLIGNYFGFSTGNLVATCTMRKEGV